jgi:hypothetical protein
MFKNKLWKNNYFICLNYIKLLIIYLFILIEFILFILIFFFFINRLVIIKAE